MNDYHPIYLLWICLFTVSLGSEEIRSHTYYLSACAIFRNEARFLKEWIEFHRVQGVQHFYLLNNLSNDDYQTVLQPYIDAKIVELQDWNYETTNPGKWPSIQCSAYYSIIKMAKKKSKWLAILDTDEFLYPVNGEGLKQFLKDFEKYGAVAVNWQMFGTGGVQHIPDDSLLIETLNFKAPNNFSGNNYVKCIVQPACVETCLNAHYCVLKSGFKQVNENKEAFVGPVTPYVSVDKIRINHYWSRDEDFFYHVKIARRNKWGESANGCLQQEKNLNQQFDDNIHQFVEALRNKMKEKVS